MPETYKLALSETYTAPYVEIFPVITVPLSKRTKPLSRLIAEPYTSSFPITPPPVSVTFLSVNTELEFPGLFLIIELHLFLPSIL